MSVFIYFATYKYTILYVLDMTVSYIISFRLDIKQYTIFVIQVKLRCSSCCIVIAGEKLRKDRNINTTICVKYLKDKLPNNSIKIYFHV